jgi:putative ABC transport system substrate-binding protein
MSICLQRREFIAGLGGAVASWPLARAQQGDRVRRIGWLSSSDENDPRARTMVSVFTRALADLGWTDGRNVRVDVRWYGNDTNRIRALAQELVGLQTDIILAASTPATVAVQGERKVYVAGGNIVSVISTETDTVTSTIGGFVNSTGVAVTPDGSKVSRPH